MKRQTEPYVLYLGTGKCVLYRISGSCCSVVMETTDTEISRSTKYNILENCDSGKLLVVLDQYAESIEWEQREHRGLLLDFVRDSVTPNFSLKKFLKSEQYLNSASTLIAVGGREDRESMQRVSRYLCNTASLDFNDLAHVPGLAKSDSHHMAMYDQSSLNTDQLSKAAAHRVGVRWKRKLRIVQSSSIEEWLGILASLEISSPIVISGALLQEKVLSSQSEVKRVMLRVSLQPSGEIRHGFYQQGRVFFSRLIALRKFDDSQLVADIEKSVEHINANFGLSDNPAFQIALKLDKILYKGLCVEAKADLKASFEIEIAGDHTEMVFLSELIPNVRQLFRQAEYHLRSDFLDRYLKSRKRSLAKNSAITTALVLMAVFALFQGWQVAHSFQKTIALSAKNSVSEKAPKQDMAPVSGDVMKAIVDLNHETAFRSRQLPLDIILKIAIAVTEYPDVSIQSLSWGIPNLDKSGFVAMLEGGAADLFSSAMMFQLAGSVSSRSNDKQVSERAIESLDKFVDRLRELLVPSNIVIDELPPGLDPDRRYSRVYDNEASVVQVVHGQADKKSRERLSSPTRSNSVSHRNRVLQNSGQTGEFAIRIELFPHEWRDRTNLSFEGQR